MNKDQIKGRVNAAEGEIKQAAGKLIGNEKMEAKGKAQGTIGRARARFGDVKQKVKAASRARS